MKSGSETENKECLIKVYAQKVLDKSIRLKYTPKECLIKHTPKVYAQRVLDKSIRLKAQTQKLKYEGKVLSSDLGVASIFVVF